MFHPPLEILVAQGRKVKPQQIAEGCEPATQGDRNVEARRLNLGLEAVKETTGIRRLDLAIPFIQPSKNVGGMIGPRGFDDQKLHVHVVSLRGYDISTVAGSLLAQYSLASNRQ
jgi:hypothetical protein